MCGTDAGCPRAAGRVAAVPPPGFAGSPDGLLRYFRHVLRAVRLPRGQVHLSACGIGSCVAPTRLLADMNISPKTVDALREQGWDAVRVSVGLPSWAGRRTASATRWSGGLPHRHARRRMK
jgi:hypothetical protein